MRALDFEQCAIDAEALDPILCHIEEWRELNMDMTAKSSSAVEDALEHA